MASCTLTYEGPDKSIGTVSYVFTNKITGERIGIFTGSNIFRVLDKMAQAMGYAHIDDMDSALHARGSTLPKEISARLV